jgi:ribosomal-protein-alanine N-acetyltransferase
MGILQTDRLTLTRMRPEHTAALVDLWTDLQVTRWMGGPREPTALEADLRKTSLNPTAEKFDLWPLVEKAGGKLIGHCGLLDKEIEGKLETELVYVLAVSAWGKGYATEIAAALKDYAFSNLGLKRLVALIDPASRASERVAIKIGMRLERKVVRPGGAVRWLYAVESRPAQGGT